MSNAFAIKRIEIAMAATNKKIYKHCTELEPLDPKSEKANLLRNCLKFQREALELYNNALKDLRKNT